MLFHEFIENETPETQKTLNTLFNGFPKTTPVRTVTLSPGECCMHQGDTEWDVYVLLSGRVDLYTHQIDYSIYTLRDFIPYAFFGHYETLADVETIIADVMAKTECRFLVFSKDAYIDWVQSDMSILIEQMQSSMRTLILQGDRDRNNLTLDSEVRLALFLLRYGEQAGLNDDDKAVTVELTHREIADGTGLSLRTITRVIAKLRDDDFIGNKRGKITITPDQAALLNKKILP